MDGNIKGLVSAGHEMASELKAECGAVDMRSVAKLISDLATQLEVQLVRANALAAENEAIKFYLRNGPVIRKGGELAAAHQFAPETPATDAFLADVRAVAFNELRAAFVRHAKVAGLDDADTVTLKEVTEALLHCAEQIRAPE
ncbi:hypothetical protein QWO11_000097 [Escherichia coli]|nr:hypothetical protein [Escherichia coli]